MVYRLGYDAKFGKPGNEGVSLVMAAFSFLRAHRAQALNGEMDRRALFH